MLQCASTKEPYDSHFVCVCGGWPLGRRQSDEMQSGSGNAEKIERYAAKAKIRTESKY